MISNTPITKSCRRLTLPSTAPYVINTAAAAKSEVISLEEIRLDLVDSWLHGIFFSAANISTILISKISINISDFVDRYMINIRTLDRHNNKYENTFLFSLKTEPSSSSRHTKCVSKR